MSDQLRMALRTQTEARAAEIAKPREFGYEERVAMHGRGIAGTWNYMGVGLWRSLLSDEYLAQASDRELHAIAWGASVPTALASVWVGSYAGLGALGSMVVGGATEGAVLYGSAHVIANGIELFEGDGNYTHSGASVEGFAYQVGSGAVFGGATWGVGVIARPGIRMISPYLQRINLFSKGALPQELYIHTWKGDWRGDVALAGVGGRIWATPYSRAQLASMTRAQRIWHIGRGKLPTDSVRVTGVALDEFVQVRGIGPFRLVWKRQGPQYFTKGPGSLDLVTGVRRADFGDRLRYAAMSTGSYTMDGLIVATPFASIYVYATGGWETTFDTILGNPKSRGK